MTTRDGAAVRPEEEKGEKCDDQVVPVEGLEVEEIDDETTIRTFVGAWRKRVSEEYARSILEGRED
jgi:hypothetical protein